MGGAQRRTARLSLHRWGPEDRAAYAEATADPETMATYEHPWTRQESDARVDEFEACFEARGYGTWAVSEFGGGFVGAVGLGPVGPELPCGPTVEIGWLLPRRCWGRGFATEAARDCLDQAFGELGLDEVVAFTAAVNARSQAVMARLGMVRDPGGDFVHPRVTAGHRLAPHVLYRARPDR